MERDPLEVDPETMRRLGYQVVDWLVERATAGATSPCCGRRLRPRWPGACRARHRPRVGTSPRSSRHLGEDVLPFRSRIDHPRYLAYVPG